MDNYLFKRKCLGGDLQNNTTKKKNGNGGKTFVTTRAAHYLASNG